MKSPLGESFGTSDLEVDSVGGQEAYEHAVELAEEVGDDRSLAAACRELAMLELTKARNWFAGEVKAGRHIEYARRLAAGETLQDILPTLPIAANIFKATTLIERALGIYERLDDRNGVMSTVIAMAYVAYAPAIHLTSSARHLEEIRRVTSRRNELVTESERATQELQMLYGIHVFSRAKVVPDLALSRAEDAYREARIQGRQSIEFLAAGGAALSHLDLGNVAEAERWIERAGTLAVAGGPTYARQLETWRGLARAVADDAAGMRRHLETAVTLAGGRGAGAARCEALARLALVAAQLGARRSDEGLLQLAQDSAEQAIELVRQLPGHAPWGAQADAALATVALARGDVAAAAEAGRAAMHALEASLHEDLSLDIVLPAARAMLAGAPGEEADFLRGYLQLALARIAQGTADEGVRVRWLRGPIGRELAELAGPLDAPVMPAAATAADHPEASADRRDLDLDEVDRRVLHLLTEGQTNAEMAAELDLSESDLQARLAKLFARIGASGRAEATSLAFRGLAPVGAR